MSQSLSPDCSTPSGRHYSIPADQYLWWWVDSSNLLDTSFLDSCVTTNPNSLLFDRDPGSSPSLRLPRACIIVAAYIPAGLTFPSFSNRQLDRHLVFVRRCILLSTVVRHRPHILEFPLSLRFRRLIHIRSPTLKRRKDSSPRDHCCNVSVSPTNGSASLFTSESSRSNATTVSGRFGCCAAVDLLSTGRS